MWLILANPRHDPVPAEAVLPDLAAVAEFAGELGARLAGDGVPDLTGVLALHARLRAVLDAVSEAELERARQDLGELTRGLETISRRLEQLARLKRLVGA